MPVSKECFIIMPLTVPETMFDKYRDGKEHFGHVLECLFMPAVEKADFKPVPPIAKGADLIHARIVKNLETAHLVLCDMSCLNPNVFFEFGIRTALNKPLCLVKDELVERVPFDADIINYDVYDSRLEPWNLPAEITKLAEHIKTSADRGKGGNDLWRYFGFKTEAAPSKLEDTVESKTDYLVSMMQNITKMLDANPPIAAVVGSDSRDIARPRGQRVIRTPLEIAAELVREAAKKKNIMANFIVEEAPNTIAVHYLEPRPGKHVDWAAILSPLRLTLSGWDVCARPLNDPENWSARIPFRPWPENREISEALHQHRSRPE